MSIIPDQVVTWLPIPGYEELYEINNQGEIRTLTGSRNWVKGRTLRACPDKYGYMKVWLANDKGRKCYGVHQLVTLTFIGECPKGLEPNHENGNKADNSVGNLTYMTHKENIQHSIDVLKVRRAKGVECGNVKLTDENILEIRWMASQGYKHTQIAKHFGVTRPNISNIVSRKAWRHVK